MADLKQLGWFCISLEMRGDTDLSEVASIFINFIARSRFLLWVTGYLLFSQIRTKFLLARVGLSYVISHR